MMRRGGAASSVKNSKAFAATSGSSSFTLPCHATNQYDDEDNEKEGDKAHVGCLLDLTGAVLLCDNM